MCVLHLQILVPAAFLANAAALGGTPTINLTVRDSGRLTDRFIGSTRLALAPLLLNPMGIMERSLFLQGPSGGGVVGSVWVRFVFVPDSIREAHPSLGAASEPSAPNSATATPPGLALSSVLQRLADATAGTPFVSQCSQVLSDLAFKTRCVLFARAPRLLNVCLCMCVCESQQLFPVRPQVGCVLLPGRYP